MSKIDEDTPPLYSLAFHLRFLPALLTSRFQTHAKPAARAAISPLGTILVVCAVLMMAGTHAYSTYPLLVLVLFGLAGLGLGYVVILSAHEARGTRPSYQGFLFGLFFFAIFLGLGAGVILGANEPAWQKWILASFGAFVGYWLGLVAGLQGQRLGFVSQLLDGLSLPAIIGLITVEIVLLFG